MVHYEPFLVFICSPYSICSSFIVEYEQIELYSEH